ncbi:hypothetical protein AN641_08485 [Candidatus Epulonipiscioides gigas]|nr:hypothetical protein AN641_08485 [Epulopiscium sp. SCG-C07WGA-EpuloA2]
MKLTTKQLVIMSILISMHVILSRTLAIHIGDIIRISLAFLITAIMATYFNLAWTIIACGVADFLAAILFPTGTFFPGFTISAMIDGFIYSIFLYRKQFSWWRIIIIKVLSLIIITMGLNSYWLSLLIGKSYIVLVIPRITEGLIMLPIEIILLGVLLKYLIPHLKLRLLI